MRSAVITGSAIGRKGIRESPYQPGTAERARVSSFRCILTANLAVVWRNVLPSAKPQPFCTWGEELLRAQFRRGACVEIGAPIFVPSCAHLASYLRTPASHPCVRISACGKGGAGCCGRQRSTAADSGTNFVRRSYRTDPFASSVYFH